MHSPVNMATVVALEDSGNGNPSVSVFNRSSELGTVIEVGATGQVTFGKEL